MHLAMVDIDAVAPIGYDISETVAIDIYRSLNMLNNTLFVAFLGRTLITRVAQARYQEQ